MFANLVANFTRSKLGSDCFRVAGSGSRTGSAGTGRRELRRGRGHWLDHDRFISV